MCLPFALEGDNICCFQSYLLYKHPLKDSLEKISGSNLPTINEETRETYEELSP